jgi:hypothetical protein
MANAQLSQPIHKLQIQKIVVNVTQDSINVNLAFI